MDPISTLFSAYLTALSNNVADNVTDMMGLEMQAVVIRYHDTDVPFQYQLWRVREQSVCGAYRDRISVYSDCTLKAKALFSDLCQELNRSPKDHWKYVKMKNMYCNAAISFHPTIAHISDAVEETALERARQKCNAATANALGSSDEGLIAERRAACKAYDDLK